MADKKVFFSFYFGLTFIMAVVFLMEAFMGSISTQNCHPPRQSTHGTNCTNATNTSHTCHPPHRTRRTRHTHASHTHVTHTTHTQHVLLMIVYVRRSNSIYSIPRGCVTACFPLPDFLFRFYPCWYFFALCFCSPCILS
jgi:hypothetical protein